MEAWGYMHTCILVIIIPVYYNITTEPIPHFSCDWWKVDKFLRLVNNIIVQMSPTHNMHKCIHIHRIKLLIWEYSHWHLCQMLIKLILHSEIRHVPCTIYRWLIYPQGTYAHTTTHAHRHSGLCVVEQVAMSLHHSITSNLSVWLDCVVCGHNM